MIHHRCFFIVCLKLHNQLHNALRNNNQRNNDPYYDNKLWLLILPLPDENYNESYEHCNCYADEGWQVEYRLLFPGYLVSLLVSDIFKAYLAWHLVQFDIQLRSENKYYNINYL